MASLLDREVWAKARRADSLRLGPDRDERRGRAGSRQRCFVSTGPSKPETKWRLCSVYCTNRSLEDFGMVGGLKKRADGEAALVGSGGAWRCVAAGGKPVTCRTSAPTKTLHYVIHCVPPLVQLSLCKL